MNVWAGQVPLHMGKVALRMTTTQRAQVICKEVLTSQLADTSVPCGQCTTCPAGGES